MKHYITSKNTIRAFEDDGSQDHLITPDMKPVELPDAPVEAWVIDYDAGEITVDQAALDAILNPVPASVSARQGMQQLIASGLDEQVYAEIDAIEDPVERKMLRAWIDRATEWERASPEVAYIAGLLGLTEPEVDEHFRQAAAR